MPSWFKRLFGATAEDEPEAPLPRYIDDKRAKAIAQAALFTESGGKKGAPQCPRCGSEMTLQKGDRSGAHFWGCTEYPTCKATRKA